MAGIRFWDMEIYVITDEIRDQLKNLGHKELGAAELSAKRGLTV